MPRAYSGPKLWLDPARGTFTILDGRKRVRTGCTNRDDAIIAIHQYTNGTYIPPQKPETPARTYRVPPRRGVYVAGYGPYVKIGFSTNITERMASLQTGAPESIEVFAILEGWASEERTLHARFASYRLKGEWFRRDGELSAWIEAGCPDQEQDPDRTGKGWDIQVAE